MKWSSKSGTNRRQLSLGEVWLYQTYFRARQSVEDMIGGFGKRPAVGPSADPVYLFGEEFDLKGVLSDDEADSAYIAFLCSFKDIVWLTYRKGYIPMTPSSYTTDTGWGCMLRSAQMLLAEVLIRHLGKREYGQRKPASHAHRNLLRWFIDAPKYFAFYSIHRMTDCGRHYGKKPGEWYGPNAVALVLRDLVNSHRLRKNSRSSSLGEGEVSAQPKFLEKDYFSIFSESGQDVSVLVSDDGTLYLDEVYAACQGEGGEVAMTDEKSKTDDDDPLLRPKAEPSWKSAMFLIVPLRLGLNELNQEYIGPLVEALKFPQCVGMIGGKPAHSLYFVGSQGTDFVYLDPHTVQEAATDAQCDDEFFPYQDVVDSYHCTTPRLIPAHTIDPCLAIGFYCKNSSELTDLVARLGQLQNVGLPFLGIMQTRPIYEDKDVVDDDIDENDDDYGMETASEGEEGESNAKDDGEQDDFVFL